MPKVTFQSPWTDFGLFGVSGVLGGQHFLHTTGQSRISDLQEHRLNSVVGKLHNSDERHMAMTAFFQLSLSTAEISRAPTVIEDRCCQKQLDQRCTQKSQRQKPLASTTLSTTLCRQWYSLCPSSQRLSRPDNSRELL